jgi:RNA polymerase sigma factor (sigma-70 family)
VNAAAYRGPGSAAAWIYGIARNQPAMAFRHRRVEDQARRRLHLEPVALTDDDLLRVEERSAVGMAVLHEAMAQLPELTRQAVMARIVDERDYDEIAVQLQCSQQVVRQRVHRGLVHLRATIGQQP